MSSPPRLTDLPADVREIIAAALAAEAAAQSSGQARPIGPSVAGRDRVTPAAVPRRSRRTRAGS